MTTEKRSAEQQAKDKVCAKAMQSSNANEARIAFNQLYKRYKNPIFYLVLRGVNMNTDIADDLTQEIFAKVFEKIQSYDHSSAFSTWMYTIANNHLIDFKRKQKIEILSLNNLNSEMGRDEEVHEFAFQIEDKFSDTFKLVLKKERAMAVTDALNNGVKSEKARQAVVFIFLEDMSYEEASKIMNLPIGSVKGLVFRAKDEMKKYLSVKSREFEYGRIREKKSKFVEEEEEVF